MKNIIKILTTLLLLCPAVMAQTDYKILAVNTNSGSENYKKINYTDEIKTPNTTIEGWLNVTNYVDIDAPSGSKTAPSTGKVRLYGRTVNGQGNLHWQDDSGIEYRIGRDLIHTVINSSGIEWTNGVVIAWSTNMTTTAHHGQLAKADADSTMPAQGIAIGTVTNGGTGTVMWMGRTPTNYLPTELATLPYGTALYVSDTTAGQLTQTPPVSPSRRQLVGFVNYDGAIDVRLSEQQIPSETSIFRTYFDSTNKSAVVTNYYLMGTVAQNYPRGTLELSVASNSQYFVVFISSNLNLTTLYADDIYQVNATMYKSANPDAVSVNAELYVWDSATSNEAEIMTSTTQAIGSSSLEYIFTMSVTTNITVDTTDRLVLKFKSSSVVSAPVTVTMSGVSLSIPVPSSQFPTISEFNDHVNLNRHATYDAYDATIYSVTNTVVVSNTCDFDITLIKNRITLDDVRMFVSVTNDAAFSKRASIQLFRNSNRRCDRLVYLDTNQLYWTAINSTLTAAGSGSNTVADTTGVVLSDLYYLKSDTESEYMRPTNTTSTIIYWGCTNFYAYTNTSLISHVNQFGGFPYYDELNTSKMWFRITFTTPWTTTVQTVINYGR